LKERRTNQKETQNPANPTTAASTRSSAARSTRSSAEKFRPKQQKIILGASPLSEKKCYKSASCNYT
jgi:hypothetical protein